MIMRGKELGMPVSIIRYLLISIVIFIPSIAFAQESSRYFDVAVALRYGLPFGDEETGYKWPDLYQNEIGGSVEISKPVAPSLSLHAGIAYDSFSGKDASFIVPPGLLVNGKFIALNPFSFYIGGKDYFLAGQHEASAGMVNPYVRVDLGMTSFNAINFDSTVGTISVGDHTTAFSYALGAGVDIWTSSYLAVLAEIKYHDYGRPGGADNTLKAFPELSIGLRYTP
jgi:hypothetical protein